MKQCIGLLAVGIALLFGSCKDNTYTIPDGVNSLTNDCLKRSLGPNMVGGSIEFAYAMAMPYGSGATPEPKRSLWAIFGRKLRD